MSRIGKKPIQLPDKIKATIHGGDVSRALIEGPKGKLEVEIPRGAAAKVEEKTIVVSPANDDRKGRALQGLTRALLQNAVVGVSEGYSRVLEIHGVGYRAEAKGSQLHFTLGYSRPIVFDLPAGVTAKTPAPTKVVLESSNKQVLGMAAADIRMLRPPEPYKGKGIRFEGETIRRKVGKTGA